MQSNKTPKMPPEKTKEIESEVVLLKKSIHHPIKKNDLEKIIRFCLDNSHYDLKTLISRLKWFDTNDYFKSKKYPRFPSNEPEKAGHSLLFPKDLIFEYILLKKSFKRIYLEEIYNNLRLKHQPLRMEDFTEERILQEIKWWTVDIGLPDYYFEVSSPEQVAKQITMNRGKELQIGESDTTSIKLKFPSHSGTTVYWVDEKRMVEAEEDIQNDHVKKNLISNISSYLITTTSGHQLWLTIINDQLKETESTRYEDVSHDFISKNAPKETKIRYRSLWQKTVLNNSLNFQLSKNDKTGEHRLMCSFPKYSTPYFISNITRILMRNRIRVNRKYYSIYGGKNPIVISSIYSPGPFPEELIKQISLISIYPNNVFTVLANEFKITPEEAIFIHCATLFIHQFITLEYPNLSLLKSKLKGEKELLGLINNMQKRTDKENFDMEVVHNAFSRHPLMISNLFKYFDLVFNPGKKNEVDLVEKTRKKITARIDREISWEIEQKIFFFTLHFIDSIERTNFYVSPKFSLSFRMKKGFLKEASYPVEPYGVIFIVTPKAYGFHVRFKDIARGGIRLIRSRNINQYMKNANNLFDEAYNLSLTQNKKNKDIPEGGAKGVILTDIDSTDEYIEFSFKKYIDGILDLLLPQNKKQIKNYQEEILFLGPDEGTAELMDWACLRAKERGYKYWQGFTTGKSGSLGGISHIDYGMTTNSVHQYVLELLERLKIKETEITKIQTGGPDGDLGSNEILLSKDSTLALIDGSGVLYDINGINRHELIKLAKKRLPVSYFNTKFLSSKGFLINITDKNVKLPDGSLIKSGELFRNTFHLHPLCRADLFVPCGGRPGSINLINWEQLLDDNGKPKFKWITEGANLFITQEARLKLEEKGVIIFKDSSANKGGVTSSSFEVLCALSLKDKVFNEWMILDGKENPFRKHFIMEVIRIIRENASIEFNILWKERAKAPISVLSDILSEKINEITDLIHDSELYLNKSIRKNILERHIPPILLKRIGIEKLMEEIPINYQHAIIAKKIANQFIYKFGLNPDYESYRLFIDSLKQ